MEEIKAEMKIKFTIVAEPKKAVSRVWLQLEEFVGREDTKSSKVEHMLVIQVTIFLISISYKMSKMMVLSGE